ncbi:glycosyltransferase family 9 protein, partial [Candidatus Ruminimicrobium bovinum]|uniref:glycosyltransferase family 9 protein n=1 Tax=Candidatus Ruminimicrobium bovinum TaxID=3242779 RepID=UPI0039B88C1C
IKAAKQQYPNVKIYSVTRKNLAELLRQTLLVDKIFIKEKGLKSKIKLISDIQNENIDVACLFSESPESLICAYLSKIKKRYGFKSASLNFLLTDKAEKKGVPSLVNNINLAKKIGIKNIQNNYLDIIKTDSKTDDKINNILKQYNIENKKFIAVSIGASKRRQEKCLKAEVWIETINELTGKNIPVIVTGAVWEKEYIKNITDKCLKKINVFCPEGGLVELSGLLKKASLFIGVDSGAMHLAASLGIKCIALYGNTDPSQIGPQPLENHIIIKKDSAKQITADDILNKIEF